MAKPIKFPFVVSPRAMAAFTWLDKPDTAFNDSKYKVTLAFDKDDIGPAQIEYGKKSVSGDEFFDYLRDIAAEHGVPSVPDKKGFPVKDGDKMTDKDGNPREAFVNKWVIQLKSKYKPDLVDTQGQRLPASVSILNGDIIRALVVPSVNTENGFLTLYLNKVCLVDKRADYAGADASVFGEDDGYVVPAGAAAEPQREVAEDVVLEEDGDF
jgi:hypothetical protein